MITFLCIKTITMSHKNKKETHAITNVNLKYISKIIREFENLTYEGYVQKRSKHVPTES